MPPIQPAVTPQPAAIQTAGFNPKRGGGNPFLSGPTTNYSTRLGSVLGIFGMPTFEERQAAATSAAAATFGKLMQSGRPAAAALIETINTPEGQAAFSDPAQWNSFLNTVQLMMEGAAPPDPLKVGQYDTVYGVGDKPIYGAGIDPATARPYPDPVAGGEGTAKERFASLMVESGEWDADQAKAYMGGTISISREIVGRDPYTNEPVYAPFITDSRDPLNPVMRPISPEAAQQAPDLQPPPVARPAAEGGPVDVNTAREAIGQIESSGRYGIKGVKHAKLGFPLGKYQIMEANLPSWSREALGREVSAEQFLNSPDIQDRVATYQMQKLYNKFGNWDDVASAWLTGRPLSKAGGDKDALGTDAPEYIRRFRAALGQPVSGVPGGGASQPTAEQSRFSVDPSYQRYRAPTPALQDPVDMFAASGVGGVEELAGGIGEFALGPEFGAPEASTRQSAMRSIGSAMVSEFAQSTRFKQEVDQLSNTIPRTGITLTGEQGNLTVAVELLQRLLELKKQAVSIYQNTEVGNQPGRAEALGDIDRFNRVIAQFPSMDSMLARQQAIKDGTYTPQSVGRAAGDWWTKLNEAISGGMDEAGAAMEQIQRPQGQRPEDLIGKIAGAKSTEELQALWKSSGAASRGLPTEVYEAFSQRAAELNKGK